MLDRGAERRRGEELRIASLHSMICLRHRSASGDLSNGWEYDAGTRRVVCSMLAGARVVEFSVAVASPKKPRVGAHPLMRLDAESFRVLPERYIVTWPNRVETIATIRCPVSDDVGYRQLALTNAPPDVVRALEVLEE